MPSALSRLQKRFVKTVLKEQGSALAGAVPGGTLSPEGALGVYREGYAARLTQALGETYESCWWVLGDAAFFRYGAAFARRFPSKVYNLSSYGAQFPAFLAKTTEAKTFPFLAELAQFEWEFKELFHQKEDAPLAPAELARAQGAPNLRLSFTGAMRVFEHRWTVSLVWKKRKGPQSAFRRLRWDQPEQVLLYKRDGDIYLIQLGRAEFALLRQLIKGRTLGQAFSSVLKGPDPISQKRTADFFALISEAGLLTALEVLPK